MSALAARPPPLDRPVGEGAFNTLSAAYAVRAVKVYSRAVASSIPELSINEIYADKTESRLSAGAKLLQRQELSDKAKAVRFRSSARGG